MDDNTQGEAAAVRFTAAEMQAIAHLYRGEIYRSSVWRTRLDATTNWAVVTTGIALSVTFSSSDATPMPLVLVGLLVAVFLLFEARRYQYFDVWRMRARTLETQFYVPLLLGGSGGREDWQRLLAHDLTAPRYHIDMVEAIGRRLRRNYGWILGIQAIAYYGKLMIHPEPVAGFSDLWARAAIGPLPGQVVVLCGVLFHTGWMALAWWTLRRQLRERARTQTGRGRDPLKVLVGARN